MKCGCPAKAWRRALAKRSKARLLKNGRNAGSTAFLMLNNYVFDCVAYRTMKSGPRELLYELIRRYNGSNNGRIVLGVRSAGKELCVGKDTAASYLNTLIERGFIESVRPGGFNMKDPQSRRATEWRLTWLRCYDLPPTKEFIDWSRNFAVQNIRTTGPEKPDIRAQMPEECPGNSDLPVPSCSSTSPEIRDAYTSSHRHKEKTLKSDASPCSATWASIRSASRSLEALA